MEEKLNFTGNDFTKKEVMSGAIGELRALTINEILSTKDEVKRQKLNEQQQILRFEEYAVLGDDEVAKSIQDKVLRLYSPMLKAYYGAK